MSKYDGKKSFPEPKKGVQSRSESGKSRSANDQGVVGIRPNRTYTLEQSEENNLIGTRFGQSSVRKTGRRKKSVREELDKVGADVYERVAAATEDHDKRVAERAQKAAKRTRQRFPTLKEINSLWFMVHKRELGRAPLSGSSDPNYQKFRASTKRNRIKDYDQFIADVCNYWDDLRQGPLSWLKDYPETPDINYVFPLIRFFRSALDEHRHQERKARDKLRGNKKTGSQTGRVSGRSQPQSFEVPGDATLPFTVESDNIHYERTDQPMQPGYGDTWLSQDGILSIYTEEGWMEIEQLPSNAPGTHVEAVFPEGFTFTANMEIEDMQPMGQVNLFIDLDTFRPDNELKIGDYNLVGIGSQYEVYLYTGTQSQWIHTGIFVDKDWVDDSSRTNVEILREIRGRR